MPLRCPYAPHMRLVPVVAFPDPLTVPTWLTAVFTSVLAVGAIVTAIFAIKAFGKQSAELEDQRGTNLKLAAAAELQTYELKASRVQREREAEAEHRAQAGKVNAWFDTRLEGGQVFYGSDGPRALSPPVPVWGAIIRNDSDLPVLDVRTFFHWVNDSGDGTWTSTDRGGPVERIRVVPPHSERFVGMPEQIRRMTDEVSDQVYVVSIEFNDAAGARWARDPHGGLIQR